MTKNEKIELLKETIMLFLESERGTKSSEFTDDQRADHFIFWCKVNHDYPEDIEEAEVVETFYNAENPESSFREY